MAQQNKIGRVATHVISVLTGRIYVQYHNTFVVEFDNKEIVLRNGGWKTQTTKTRMNQTSNQYGLGFTVFQKNYDWFVKYEYPSGGSITIPFKEGMIIKRK